MVFTCKIIFWWVWIKTPPKVYELLIGPSTFFFFSTFDVEHLVKIHRLQWKVHNKIIKFATFEGDFWKLAKIWIRKVVNFYRHLYGGCLCLPPPQW